MKMGAVIDYCSANGIYYTKRKIFKFLDVPQATGYVWFPVAASPNFRRPQQPADASSVSLSTLKLSPSAKLKNPVRNSG